MKLNKTQKKYRKVMNKMARKGKLHDKYGAKIHKLDWKIDEQQAQQDAKKRQLILLTIMIVLAIILIQKYDLTNDIAQGLNYIFGRLV